MVSPTKASEAKVTFSHDRASNKDSEQEHQDAIGQLEKVNSKIKQLDDLACAEILKINQKYYKLCEPFFHGRSQLISKVPRFWFSTLLGHPLIRGLLQEEDREALLFLTWVNVIDSKDSYRIDFHFDENPYFENRVLSKKFHYSKSRESSESPEIKWKAGMGLIRQTQNNTDRRKRQYQGPGRLLFWFTDHSSAADKFGEIIKNDIWRDPLAYYLAPEESNAGGDEYLDATEHHLPEQTQSNPTTDAEEDGEGNEGDDGCGWSGVDKKDSRGNCRNQK